LIFVGFLFGAFFPLTTTATTAAAAAAAAAAETAATVLNAWIYSTHTTK